MKTRSMSLFVALFLAFTASAKEPVFSTRDGAIRGYDPVAYFTEKRPLRGKVDITHEWNGAIWRFVNRENRDAFMALPEKYAPAYGGYCAYAVANGYTATTDPDAWSIVDGRLFLNYSLGVKERWEKNIGGYIKKADENWPGVLSK